MSLDELGAARSCGALGAEPLTVVCAHSERAMNGASLLVARGYPDVVLDGGPVSWLVATGRPLGFEL